MSKILELKQKKVTEVTTKLQGSVSTVVTDYRGLTVKQTNDLRAQLRAAGVDYSVIKNTVTRRATEATGLVGMDIFLTGPSAIAFSSEDVVAPAKILFNFSKDNKALEIKGGVVEGKVVTADEIKALALLPSREGLLSMLLSVMQAPVRNFALALKAIAEKKENEQTV